jgi:hypothetical protein
MTPMEIMERAIERGVDADQLEKLMALQERWEANQARRAFAAALSEFQARCPTVLKTAEADRYTYAPLDEILRTIRPHMEATGLSVRFSTELTEESVITAVCILSHRDGHSETSHFAAPVDRSLSRDGKPLMNVTQQMGSANTYAKRYALLNALNIVASSFEDDDGYAAGIPMLTDRQVVQLRDYIEAYELNEKKFLGFINAPSLEEIPASKWPAAETAIFSRIEQIEKQKGAAN